MINKILIVKISSLGDIIQSIPILNEIKTHLPECAIDWVVKKEYENLIKSHPLIDSVIVYEPNHLPKFIKRLRKNRYDALFDLQGNTKSAFVTLFSKAKQKIGFGRKTVREFPNLLVTTHKYNVSKEINIQSYYLSLVRKHFKIDKCIVDSHLNLKLSSNDEQKIQILGIDNLDSLKIMIAMGSRWKNKELDPLVLYRFLKKIKKHLNVAFYFVYGTDQEKKVCLNFKDKLGDKCTVLGKMGIPLWQNVMKKMDLILTVDTAALHLAATTNVTTFSFFGPTSNTVFKPQGMHFAVQGSCPYDVRYIKQCPYLRKCKTGDCIKKITVEVIWEKFLPCLETLKAKKFTNT